MGDMRKAYTNLVGIPQTNDRFEDLRVDERIISKWVLIEIYSCLRTRFNDDFCENGNEPSGSIKAGKTINDLNNY
jgi:hypothetical protein